MRLGFRARRVIGTLATGLVPAALVAIGVRLSARDPQELVQVGRLFLRLAPWLACAAGWIAAAVVIAARRGQALAELDRVSEAVGRGEVGEQLEVLGGGELKRIGQVFNYMSMQLLAYQSETRKLYEGLEQSYLQTMLAFASVIESKDRYTLGHSQRVGEFAATVGRELGLPDHEVRHLLWGGVLHDIGKIGVIEPILGKRSGLTPDEMHAMRAHPVIGASIVAGIPFLRPVIAAVRHHHERWDGSGYPDGLREHEIPLIARIVGAADVWDACTSTRTYQQAMTVEAAIEVIRRLNGTQLDPGVVEAIESVVRRRRDFGAVGS